MPSKFKVLQINSVYGSGSTGNIVKNLMLTMRDEGIEPLAAYGIGKEVKDSNILKFSDSLSVKTDILLSRITGKTGCFNRKGTAVLINWIKEKQPDIIHLHNIHGFYINVPMLLKFLKQYGRPVVWTMHDCWTFTGHCAHFETIDCDKWHTHCENCKGLWKYPASYKDRSKKNFDEKKELFSGLQNLTIVTPSRWLAECVKSSYLKDYQVRVINNGIDLNVFRPIKTNLRSELGINDGAMILGMANKWLNPRNKDTVMKIAEALEGKGKAVIIGSEEQSMHKNIICVPTVTNASKMAEYYSAADMFINLTLEDTFPTVNIEALACGIPVITYRTGGSPEILNGDTGYCVEKFNFNDIIEKIDVILRNGRAFYEEKCIARANNRYDYKKKFLEYIELYNEIIAKE